MSLWDTFKIALRALLKNKMRAGLTVLGVVIGIAAVTTMVSIGQSASALVQGQFEALGTNVIVVIPASQQRCGVRQATVTTLTSGDADAIGEECPAVLAASPIVGATGQVIFGRSNWNPREMQGVGADYLMVRNWQIEAGGFFSRDDIRSSAKVCVIGHTLVAKLFQTANPIDQNIRIKNIPFRVIGVLAKKGANMVGDDQDDIILMPHTTVRKRLQGSNFGSVNAIMVSAVSPELMSTATREIEQILYERHDIPAGEQPDFRVQNTTEIAATLGIITGTLTLMLSAIAIAMAFAAAVGIFFGYYPARRASQLDPIDALRYE